MERQKVEKVESLRGAIKQSENESYGLRYYDQFYINKRLDRIESNAEEIYIRDDDVLYTVDFEEKNGTLRLINEFSWDSILSNRDFRLVNIQDGVLSLTDIYVDREQAIKICGFTHKNIRFTKDF